MPDMVPLLPLYQVCRCGDDRFLETVLGLLAVGFLLNFVPGLLESSFDKQPLEYLKYKLSKRKSSVHAGLRLVL